MFKHKKELQRLVLMIYNNNCFLIFKSDNKYKIFDLFNLSVDKSEFWLLVLVTNLYWLKLLIIQA